MNSHHPQSTIPEDQGIPETQGSIVVIDDNPDNLRVVATMLTGVDYEIRPYLNGCSAIKSIRSALPDLVLLDFMMPNMSGLEVCQELKNDELTCELPIIFLTASNDREHLQQAFSNGAVDYITKPFDAFELLARVRTHVDLKRAKETQAKLIKELQNALDHVKLLSGLLPICAWCKKVRDDEGYWEQIEGYISKHSEAKVSRGICPECVSKYYGQTNLPKGCEAEAMIS